MILVKKKKLVRLYYHLRKLAQHKLLNIFFFHFSNNLHNRIKLNQN